MFITHGDLMYSIWHSGECRSVLALSLLELDYREAIESGCAEQEDERVLTLLY